MKMRKTEVKQDNHFQELTTEDDEEEDEEEDGEEVQALTSEGIVSFHRLMEVL